MAIWLSTGNVSAFTAAVKGGKGLVVYHHASSAFVGGDEFGKEFEKMIAGGWRKQGNHGKRHEFTVTIRKADHPITKGLPAEFAHASDELYANSVIFPDSVVLAPGSLSRRGVRFARGRRRAPGHRFSVHFRGRCRRPPSRRA